MFRAALLCLLSLAITASGLATPATAVEPPWKRLNLFRHVEADPEKAYEVSKQNGPWMIIAASFGGEGGLRQAEALIFELRKKYKLEAYLHSRTFDYSKSMRGRGLDKWGNPKRMKYNRAYKDEEIAVLVGNYPAVDDPQAQRDLEKIKFIYPDAMRPKADGKTNQQLAWWHNIQRRVTRKRGGKPKGPMGRAWVITNPLLPREFFATKQVDGFIESMNKHVQYSLLDCKGTYTVQVAAFGANQIIDQSKIRDIQSGARRQKSQLAAAAEKAHKVCLTLRERGYEAYEFHDRRASIVTVGSFDSVGTPRKDGKTEINPQVHKIIQTFSAKKVDIVQSALSHGQPGTPHGIGRQPERVAGILLDLQAIPVRVPKRSFASSFTRR